MGSWGHLPGAAIAALLAVISLSLVVHAGVARPARSAGWRYIGPGVLVWLAIYGCGAMAGLFLYVRLFVGSARPDADQQMFMTTFLVMGFGGAALLFAFVARAMLQAGIGWNDERIEYTGGDGKRVSFNLQDVASIEYVGWHFADHRLRFVSGEVLDIVGIAGGVHALFADVATRISARDEILAASAVIATELVTENTEMVTFASEQRSRRASICLYTFADATATDQKAACEIAQRLTERQLFETCDALYVGPVYDGAPDGYILYRR